MKISVLEMVRLESLARSLGAGGWRRMCRTAILDVLPGRHEAPATRGRQVTGSKREICDQIEAMRGSAGWANISSESIMLMKSSFWWI
jgi:hypothetical protein